MENLLFQLRCRFKKLYISRVCRTMMSFIDVMQFLLIIGTVTSDQETELKRVNAPSVDVYSSNLSKIISYLTTTM